MVRIETFSSELEKKARENPNAKFNVGVMVITEREGEVDSELADQNTQRFKEYLKPLGIKGYPGTVSTLEMTGTQLLDLKQHINETSENPYISHIWELSNETIFRFA